jgi:hypothetical protein
MIKKQKNKNRNKTNVTIAARKKENRFRVGRQTVRIYQTRHCHSSHNVEHGFMYQIQATDGGVNGGRVAVKGETTRDTQA